MVICTTESAECSKYGDIITLEPLIPLCHIIIIIITERL